MTRRSWKYKPGDKVTYCPTCRRDTGGIPIILGHVDFRNQVCRCGRPWNRIAKQRLRNWMCRRKEPYTLEQAQTVINKEWRVGSPVIYRCPFDNHYHIGEPLK